MIWKRMVLLSLLLLAAGFVSAPSSAWAQPDAVLYELTENVVYGGAFSNGAVIFKRDSTSALMGTAQVGTPLCPASVQQLNPWAKTCTITAIGSDDVDLNGGGTGTGTVWGTISIVVDDPGENMADAPEILVAKGSFAGQIDLSPAIVYGIPLGYISKGTLTMFGTQFPFHGTFRLPFSMSNGNKVKAIAGKDAFYLDDTFKPLPVRQDERALGWPNVRFEVTFD